MRISKEGYIRRISERSLISIHLDMPIMVEGDYTPHIESPNSNI